MFSLRNVTLDDLDDLYELSQVMLFINLPPDKEIIKERIESSIQAFEAPSKDLSKNFYIFCLEDLQKKKVMGVSMIHAQHGTAESPHFYLSVGLEEKYSSSLNMGMSHGTLKLGLDSNGPTEIGGLILHPNYRGNSQKLGKQLSFVRFLYMALHQNQFKDKVHSELMPPFDSQGKSPLWEALGRRFMNMEYSDADILSRSNKEFILNLFPSQAIYCTLLPPKAQEAIGKIGPETIPVKKMLEGIGMTYQNEVDPFDGGPHYRANLKDILPVKMMRKVKILPAETDLKNPSYFLICLKDSHGEFEAIMSHGELASGQYLTKDESLLKDNIDRNKEYTLIPLSFNK